MMDDGPGQLHRSTLVLSPARVKYSLDVFALSQNLQGQLNELFGDYGDKTQNHNSVFSDWESSV
jgi:hypothetical protein